MDIALAHLGFDFYDRPLLIGGRAMEFYGIRPSGPDIDLVASPADHARLTEQYPTQVKDVYGDLGVIHGPFEVWNTICTFDYAALVPGAVEDGDHLVIAIDNLLMLKAMAMQSGEKSRRDAELIGNFIRTQAYARKRQT
ncbi:hypothetical protein ACDA63_16090 [Uliginosibacterium sp. sgz301328]|uniref:hypothetical protein n=1 Tax=Uliginosibacterium sp. sgz301328 TaxID=3243764 RepID=UPI00359D30A4